MEWINLEQEVETLRSPLQEHVQYQYFIVLNRKSILTNVHKQVL
jgi:hypothetical protein